MIIERSMWTQAWVHMLRSIIIVTSIVCMLPRCLQRLLDGSAHHHAKIHHVRRGIGRGYKRSQGLENPWPIKQ
jgi:hypothetical protein